MQNQQMNDLMLGLDQPTEETALQKLFGNVKHTPNDNLKPKDQEKLDQMSIEEVNEVPVSFRKKLEKNRVAMPESVIRKMYVFAENLRRKDNSPAMIRNAIKIQFGIAEYD